MGLRVGADEIPNHVSLDSDLVKTYPEALIHIVPPQNLSQSEMLAQAPPYFYYVETDRYPENGQRHAFFVADLKESSQIPAVVERLFEELNAAVTITPVDDAPVAQPQQSAAEIPAFLSKGKPPASGGGFGMVSNAPPPPAEVTAMLDKTSPMEERVAAAFKLPTRA